MQEPTVPEERIVRKPVRGLTYATYGLVGLCVLVMVSNIGKCGRDAGNVRKSSQAMQLSVPRPDVISEFSRQQEVEVARMKRQAAASDSAIAKGKEGYDVMTSHMPCYPEIAGTRGATPQGAPIICGKDGAWHPASATVAVDVPVGAADPKADARAKQAQAAVDAGRQKREEAERRRLAALQSPTVAIDFSQHREPAPVPAEAAGKPVVELREAPASTAQPTTNRVKYDWATYTGKTYKIFEGTILETVLTNRVNGAGSGPINVMVSTDVWSHDKQKLLIPQGTRCLGTVGGVNSGNQQRLFVAFHRCIMPDGYPVDLDRFPGLNQIGEVGLRDLVNHHYVQVFGASLAVGAIGGLAQIGNFGGGYGYDPGSAVRMGVSQQTSQEAIHILDRFLNQLPTFIVRERARVKIYLSADLDVPAYDSHTLDPTL